MKRDSVAYLPKGLSSRLSSSDTSWQIGNVSRKVGFAFLKNYGVPHERFPFNPACRKTLAKVPGRNSSDGLPATVTKPLFVGCLNCL